MNYLANVKNVNLISPSGYTGAQSLQGAVDTQGFEFATIVVNLATNTASASFSACVQHSDTNGSFTNIDGTGLIYATPGVGTGLYVWNLDLRAANTYKRWLNIKVDTGYSVTGTQQATAYAFLGSPSLGVYTAGGNGATQYFEG